MLCAKARKTTRKTPIWPIRELYLFKHYFNIQHSNIPFLDILIYKDKNNTLQKILYQNPLINNAVSVHIQTIQNHLKKALSQAPRIKTICSTLTEYKKHCAIQKQSFIERGYEENILKDQIEKVDHKYSLRKKEKYFKDRIPCLITYNIYTYQHNYSISYTSAQFVNKFNSSSVHFLHMLIVIVKQHFFLCSQPYWHN